ncbi:radical SAM protein [Candidatus Woesearchaeota archaeon]|nr:radical SAM protein [Candidatus Woesearchaeota archaeon]
MLTPNQFYSYNINELPKGCQYCVKGEKLVYFATGICPRKCYFCPISDEKYGKDVTFANERKVSLDETQSKEDIGGDPLAKLQRTLSFIRLMKEKYGKQFHIHLYTSLHLVTENTLQQLHDAGLDEIRFHLDFDSEQFWPKLSLAKKFSWDVGVELPIVPTKEKEMKKVLDFIQDKVNFLVLNELEVADNSQSKLLEMGFTPKDQASYAVKGSLEFGLELLQYAQQKNPLLKVHLCTAQLKDRVQLGNRFKREAQGVKKKFDHVDEEGLLTRGALYLPELVPGFSYRKKIEECDKEPLIKKLKILAEEIKKEFQLKEEEIFIDEQKPRILLSAKKIAPLKKRFLKKGLIPAIVKEYPTADQLEIEVELFEK